MIDPQLIIETANRRKKFLETLGETACLLGSSFEKMRNNDVDFGFRQNSDFTYLTGFPEPDSLALFDPNHPTENYVLFVRESDKFMELWHGFRYGIDGTKETFKPDAVYSIKDLETILTPRLKNRQTALVADPDYNFKTRLTPLFEACDGERLKEIRSALDYQRMIKSAWEIEQMQKANDISVEAHKKLMSSVLKANFEYELQAEFDYVCTKSGHRLQAYSQIVASGVNACCLHYGENNQAIDREGVVLVDAGVEVNSYAADITRTFPANGRFSQEQAELYDLTLKAMNEVIEACKPGVTLPKLHELCIDVLVDGLLELGLLTGNRAKNIEDKTFRKFFPHGTSHFLGLDVHDVGGRGPVALEEGMSFTVEPGIYVQTYDETAPERYRGIGIRIEDNIVITKDGYLNLTKACPKERADVEALVQQG